MSESGHSQPGLYERRRRWNREKELGHQSLSGPGRERDYVPWDRDRDRDRDRREPMDEPVGTMMQKTPIILAKPPAERVAPASAPGPAPAATPPMEKPIVLMKSREEGKGPAGTTEVSAQPPAAVAKVEKEGQRPTQPVYQIQNRGMGSAASSGVMDPVYLLDQTDVLVVGVLGLQGTGKSMVMSLLSANQPEEDQRWVGFKKRKCLAIGYQIDPKRIAPILSPSILDHLINNDRKLPPEYNLPHTYVEMQSLQIAAFLFTVCHVVIVVQDWFTDLSLYRFLQTAEMVKPSTPSPSHESSSSSGSDEGTEYYPHVVFLQNKAKRENFCPRNLKQMHLVIDKIMMHSHLKYKGTLSMLECNIFPGLPQSYLDTEVNLFLLPFMDSETDDVLPRATPGSGPLFSLLPGYKGHPSFQSLIAKLRSQMMSMSRPQLSHTILTEKNWFHYAARIWDGVKKSSALSEYSRLLA
ncbi:hypothetical protein Chor_005301 [Crotalus horridus]